MELDSDKQIVEWQRFLILLHVKCYADDYGVIKGIFFMIIYVCFCPCLFIEIFLFFQNLQDVGRVVHLQPQGRGTHIPSVP